MNNFIAITSTILVIAFAVLMELDGYGVRVYEYVYSYFIFGPIAYAADKLVGAIRKKEEQSFDDKLYKYILYRIVGVVFVVVALLAFGYCTGDGCSSRNSMYYGTEDYGTRIHPRVD